MKKVILSCLVASAIFACSPKFESTSAAAYPAEAVGYNVDSSTNIELVKKMVLAFEASEAEAILTTASYTRKRIIAGERIIQTNPNNFLIVFIL